MQQVDWVAFIVFAAAVMVMALYGLAVSGHFPAEVRDEKLRHGFGAVLLWATMIATLLAGVFTLVRALGVLPWYAAVIGGGGMLLFAPLLLRPLPDRFVNGRRALVTFTIGAALLAAAIWSVT